MPDTTARHAALLQEAEQRGLLGVDDRDLAVKLPSALVDEAMRVTGIGDPTELLRYALTQMVLEERPPFEPGPPDERDRRFVKKLFELEGTIPPGTLSFEG
jgi:hypothetical protein